jgi:poly-gamma-glutamate synthase PgsB/CapB
MTTTLLLLLLTVVLVVLGLVEHAFHRRNVRRIPIRVHVNGTRGKSSVTRLIAAGLREAGVRTCAKTTGTVARLILPDGREVAVSRLANPNIIEQRRIVAIAAACEARALVVECMALSPELQALSEFKLIRATHCVITNVRPDHLDVMGPTGADVAKALAGSVPPHGRLYTAEHEQLNVLHDAAKDRRAELIVVSDRDIDSVTAEDIAGFRHTEHVENVALALRVCADLGVERTIALRGMHAARSDPGALTRYEVDFFGRRLVFYNAFAANDPVSTEQIWARACNETRDVGARIAVFNCRGDRPERAIQLGKAFVAWPAADHVLLTGTGIQLFARAAKHAGYDASKLLLLGELSVDEIFERVVALVHDSGLVVGMGNVRGIGLALARHFATRARAQRGSS